MGSPAAGPEAGVDDTLFVAPGQGETGKCRRSRSALSADAAGGRARLAISPELGFHSGALFMRRGRAVAGEAKRPRRSPRPAWIAVSRNRAGSGNRSAKPWLPGCAEAGNAHCGRKPVGSTLGSHPLVGRLHGFAERLPARRGFRQRRAEGTRSAASHCNAIASGILTQRTERDEKCLYYNALAKLAIFVSKICTQSSSKTR